MFKWPRRRIRDKHKGPVEKVDPSTDHAWEEWGRRDPYFGVITHSRFRRAQMTAQDRQEFFDSGRLHVDYLMRTVRLYVDPNFTPRSALDFGCGVGRIVIPLAPLAQQVTGADVSSAMLEEAQRNCQERQLRNVSLIATDDSLAALAGPYDLIHSYIVFQHIPVERGLVILRNLLTRLTPGGVGALQFAYGSRRTVAEAIAAAEVPASSVSSESSAVAQPLPPVAVLESDPQMQMNVYPMNELLALLQEFNILRFHAEFTDHGGELGVFLFFASEATPAGVRPHAAGTARPA